MRHANQPSRTTPMRAILTTRRQILTHDRSKHYELAHRSSDVRYWPLADIASCTAHGGGSGHLFLRMPSSKSEALTRELEEATRDYWRGGGKKPAGGMRCGGGARAGSCVVRCCCC